MTINNQMTVEEYLELQCEEIIRSFQQHTQEVISKLRNEYEIGTNSLKQLMQKTISNSIQISVSLKCVAGPHLGQKFLLEGVGVELDDVFKIGRSTSKQFKEKGVSLYKDKEVSTTHAKVEIKNSNAYFVDMKSTNGSQVNGEDCEEYIPYRLKDGDIITLGSSELEVQVLNSENNENIASV